MSELHVMQWGDEFVVIRHNPDGKYVVDPKAQSRALAEPCDMLACCPSRKAADAAKRLLSGAALVAARELR